jgi:hypothetical protein
MLLHVCLRNLLHLRMRARRHSYSMSMLLEMLGPLMLRWHLLWQAVCVHGRCPLMRPRWVPKVCELSGSRLLVHRMNILIVHRRIGYVSKVSILGGRGWRRRRAMLLRAQV